MKILKHTTLMAVLMSAALGAHAQESPTQQCAGQSPTQTTATGAQTPQTAPTPVSASPGEFLSRTVHVARQQAEAEVHYETRVRVQNLFDGVFKR